MSEHRCKFVRGFWDAVHAPSHEGHNIVPAKARALRSLELFYKRSVLIVHQLHPWIDELGLRHQHVVKEVHIPFLLGRERDVDSWTGSIDDPLTIWSLDKLSG